MARPPKDVRFRMITDLRIPVTAEQKRLIVEAIAEEPNGMASWARQVLLQAAQDRLACRPNENKSSRKTPFDET